MKKIELNKNGRKVLNVLTWLITLSVISTLGISGTGLFGSLTFYAGILFLAFVYFNDEELQKTVKKSMVVAFAFVLVFFLVKFYGNILDAFEVLSKGAYKAKNIISTFVEFAKYAVVGAFILYELLFDKDAAQKKAVEAKATEEASQAENTEEKAE